MQWNRVYYIYEIVESFISSNILTNLETNFNFFTNFASLDVKEFATVTKLLWDKPKCCKPCLLLIGVTFSKKDILTIKETLLVETLRFLTREY